MNSFRNAILNFIPREEEALRSGQIDPHLPDALHFGCNFRHIRNLVAAQYSIENFPGDLVEIGVLEGGTTIELAKLADRYGRRVIAVDPFNFAADYIGHGGCSDHTRANFYERMANYLHIVDVLENYSTAQQVVDFIKAREICFGYIDGSHTYEACKFDIETLWHCTGIIALDDLWMEGVKQAFLEAGERPGREAFYSDKLAEGYLLKCIDSRA